MAIPPEERQQPKAQQGAVVPGLRAKTALSVIHKASAMVAARITLDAVEQSFPDFNETPEDQQFLRALTERAVNLIKAGFEVRRIWSPKSRKRPTRARMFTGNLGAHLHAERPQRLHGPCERRRCSVCCSNRAQSPRRTSARCMEVCLVDHQARGPR